MGSKTAWIFFVASKASTRPESFIQRQKQISSFYFVFSGSILVDLFIIFVVFPPIITPAFLAVVPKTIGITLVLYEVFVTFCLFAGRTYFCIHVI